MQPIDNFANFGSNRSWNWRNTNSIFPKDLEDTTKTRREDVDRNDEETCEILKRMGIRAGLQAKRNSSVARPNISEEPISEEADCEKFYRLCRVADQLAHKGKKNVDETCEEKETVAIENKDGCLMSGNQDDGRDDRVSNAFRLDGPPSAETTVGGKAYDYFGGDGYLGLQSDPEMIATACNAAVNYGVASATSRNCFTSAPLQEVERNAARFFKVPTAFYALDEITLGELFLRTLVNVFERAFVDEASEPFWRTCFQRFNGGASDVTARFSRVREFVVFKHCNPEDLREKLQNELALGERPLLLTDGVFSNFGTVAPLKAYEKILQNFGDSAMLIDDSHGIGVLGETGRGTLEHFHFDLTRVNQTGSEVTFEDSGVSGRLNEPDFSSGMMGEAVEGFSENELPSTPVKLYMFASMAKAVGGFGCVAAGSELFVEKLREFGDSCCVAPPNSVAAATAFGLRLLEKSDDRRGLLMKNVEHLRAGLRSMGIAVEDSPTPIIALQIGSTQNMRRIQQELVKDRFLTTFLPVKYNGSLGVLRIAVFATHSPETIDHLLATLKRILG